MSGLSNSQIYSALGCLTVVTLLVYQRRVICSFSVIGAFCLCFLLQAIIGILIIPWLPSSVVRFYFTLDYTLRTTTDAHYGTAVIIVVSSLVLVLLSYNLCWSLTHKGRILQRASHFLTPLRQVRLDLHGAGLFIVSGVTLLTVCFLSRGMIQTYQSGLQALITGSRLDVITARGEFGGEYVLVLLTFNILPFLAVAQWLYADAHGGTSYKLYSRALAAITGLMLILTFQKRPFLVSLGALLIASEGLRILRTSDKKALAKIRWRWVRHGLVLLLVFVLLYYLQVSHDSSVGKIVGLAFLNLLTRSGIGTLLFVRMYPEIHPHYGLSNVGLLSQVFGFERYKNTADVGWYTLQSDTRVCAGSTTEFYTAFGWLGFVVCCLMLGVVFFALDALIRPRWGGVSAMLLLTFMCIFAFTTVETTIYQAILGCGGGLFLLLWFMLDRSSVRYPHMKADEGHRLPLEARTSG